MNILKRPELYWVNPTTNDSLRRLSSSRRQRDSWLVGLQGMRNASAFKSSLICQMQLLIISCSRLAKVDGRRPVIKVTNPSSWRLTGITAHNPGSMSVMAIFQQLASSLSVGVFRGLLERCGPGAFVFANLFRSEPASANSAAPKSRRTGHDSWSRLVIGTPG